MSNALVQLVGRFLNATVEALDGAFSPVVDPTLEPLYEYIHMLQPDLPAYPHPEYGGIQGSWFLSPKHHMIEGFLLALASVLLVVLGWKRLHRPEGVYQTFVRLDFPLSRRRVRSCGEVFWLVVANIHKVVVTVTLVVAVYYKHTIDQKIFLLQPCHMSNVVLVIITWMPRRMKQKHLLFNLYVCTMWTTLMALGAPDLRAYTRFMEVEHFFIQHISLISAPIAYIYSGEVEMFPFSIDVVIFVNGLITVHHALLLSPLAVVTGRNLNYLLSPPPGTFLEEFSRIYRPPMYVFCNVLMFFFRGVLVEGLLWLFPPPLRHSLDKNHEDGKLARNDVDGGAGTGARNGHSNSNSNGSAVLRLSDDDDEEEGEQRSETAMTRKKKKKIC